MGTGDNRRTPKMKKRRAQQKKKDRIKAKISGSKTEQTETSSN